jgi:hypothetical protein
MSALRKEEPLTTADIAGQRQAGRTRDDVAVDQSIVDAADRRPPQSVAGSSTAVRDIEAARNQDDTNRDDTDDGEVVSSSVEPLPAAGSTGAMPQTSTSGAGMGRQPANRPPASLAGRKPAVPQTTAAGPPASGRNENALFDQDELRDFRTRWDQVQTSFVDEPRHAVEQADTLVATIVKRIAEQFADEREKLEQQWHRGDEVSTEDLRQGLKRYRGFFDRLLSF